MTLSSIDIFMLGWNECLKALAEATDHDYYVAPAAPNTDRIIELIHGQPRTRRYPVDVSEMKEHAVG